MQSILIPRYIDSTPQVFFWEIDEFMILALMLGLGILIGGVYTIISIFAGFFCVNVFRRYKEGGLPGQLNHIAHWHNVLNLNPVFIRSGNRRLFK